MPYHWVSRDDNNLMWPPKGKITGEYVKKWLKPKSDWRMYPITKTLLEFGDKKRCDEFLRNHVDSSTIEESDSDRTITGNLIY